MAPWVVWATKLGAVSLMRSMQSFLVCEAASVGRACNCRVSWAQPCVARLYPRVGRAVPGRLFEREADLQRDLPMGHLAVADVPARFGDLEPLHVAHRLVRLGDGVAHRILDADGRRSRELQAL